MYEKITEAILKLLQADTTLNRQIKGWYFGRHDVKKPNTRFPFIDCKWTGGPVNQTKTGVTITRRKIAFEIRCVHKHVDEDVAEKFVMEMTDQIESVLDLDANSTLGDTVEEFRITDVLSDEIPEGGYSVVGSMTRLLAKK